MSDTNLTNYLRELRAEGERLRANASGDVPRRIDMQRWSPAERAIYDAMQAVEATGAHPLLTEAVVLLGQAREKVADYVDHPAPHHS